MAEVLKQKLERDEAIRRRGDLEREARESERVKRETEEQETRQWEKICEKFELAFPDMQARQAAIVEWTKRLNLPFRGEGARVLAIRGWWQNHHS